MSSAGRCKRHSIDGADVALGEWSHDVKYLLLLANAPDAWDDPGPTGDDGVTGDWTTYTNALRDAGVLVSGAGLHDPDTATAVRVREGKRLLTDGPFVETKEHVVGFYMIDVPDLDSALDWAARVPNARTGVIEVRPAASAISTLPKTPCRMPSPSLRRRGTAREFRNGRARGCGRSPRVVRSTSCAEHLRRKYSTSRRSRLLSQKFTSTSRPCRETHSRLTTICSA